MKYCEIHIDMFDYNIIQLHTSHPRLYILNDTISRVLQFRGGKIANFQIMGPSSLNIHFWVLGVLCFFSPRNSQSQGYR